MNEKKGIRRGKGNPSSIGRALTMVAYACLVGIAAGALMFGVPYLLEQLRPEPTPEELAVQEAEYEQIRENSAEEAFAQLKNLSAEDITEFDWEFGGFLDLEDFDLNLLFDDGIELVGPMDYTVRRGDARGFEITLSDGISMEYDGYFTDGSLDKTFGVLSSAWDYDEITIKNPALWEVLKNHVDPEW
jgi:hypothetical protein